MPIIDLNGKQLKRVAETQDLITEAEQMLNHLLKEVEEQSKALSKDYAHLPNFQSAIDWSVESFLTRIEELRTIIKKGQLTNNFLGMEQIDDYSDMRKDLLKEAMYYIENNK